MARVPDLEFGELSPEQRRIFEEIAGPRGGVVRGPFAIWMRLPSIADRMNQAGNALHADTKLEKRLFELAVLTVARHWTAQYEWYAHERAALRVGLSSSVIDALCQGRPPDFEREDERLVYDVVLELSETRSLSQTTYDRALAGLGLERLIVLVTVAGFYTSVAMVLNAFDAPVPDGGRPLSEPVQG